MPHISIEDREAKEIFSGIDLRTFWGDNMLLSVADLTPGAILPPHSHPHEQITLVLEGTLEFTLDNETKILNAGQGVTVASNVPHSARSLDGPARVLDAWHPVREDYK